MAHVLFVLFVLFVFVAYSAVQHILIIWVTCRVSYKRQELLLFTSTWVHKRLLDWLRFTHLFSFLCCSIMYLYVVSSVLRCPLRYPHKNYFRVVFTSRCLQKGSCLMYVICGWLVGWLVAYMGVQHILPVSSVQWFRIEVPLSGHVYSEL